LKRLSIFVTLSIAVALTSSGRTQAAASTPAPTTGAAAKPYVPGRVYAVKDKIDVGGGTSLTLAPMRVEAGAPVSHAVIVTFIGAGHQTLFAQAPEPERSSFSLTVGQQRLNPSSYEYLEPSTCKGTHLFVQTSFAQNDGRMAQSGSTCHPLVLKFSVPSELVREKRILEIQDFTLFVGSAKKVLALRVKLN
jgi:hypothetical protein